MTVDLVICGSVLAFRDNPFRVPLDDALVFIEDGAVAIEGGKIKDFGERTVLEKTYHDCVIEHHPGCILSAGFIDAHLHYPQIDIIGAHNEGLLDWLDRHAFPQEMRFNDTAFAKATARFFLTSLYGQGVTSGGVYCTVHEESVDAFFEEASVDNAAMTAGKVCMDRHAPPALTDSAKNAYDVSKKLIDRWHGKGRNHYAITPRFAITSSNEQLEALGALWREYPIVAMHTHLSESLSEIEEIKTLFPDSNDYFDVYEKHGLSGPGAIFGHCVHLNERELRAIEEQGCAIAHCPTSNAFLGSGHFNLRGLRCENQKIMIGLASDIGGGTSCSMFATMRGAYLAARVFGETVSPGQLFYLATVEGAKAMRREEEIGNIVVGNIADLVVTDLEATPILSRMKNRAQSIEDLLMALVMAGENGAVKKTFIAGKPVYERG